MTNEMSKRFNKLFWKGKDETAYWRYEKGYEAYKSFIQSEIDRAIQEERQRAIKEKSA